MASATLLNATGNSLSGEGLSGGSLHSSLSCNGLSSDSCASNNLSINHSANLHESSRLDHRPTRSKHTLSDINNNGNSIPGNTMSQSDLISPNTAGLNASSLNASNLSSAPNSSTSSSGNPNASNNCLTSSSNSNSSNLSQAGSLNSADSNHQQTNSTYSNRSAEMLKAKQSSLSGSNSPQDYFVNKKTGDSSMNKSAFSSNLYSEVAMDVKVISQDCVIYCYCSDVNTAIEDHFKRALNTNIYSNSNDKHKDPNDRLLSVPLSQRNLPSSFWNPHPQQQSHHNHFQSNLVSDHSHHYLPLIEPSASSSSLQPLLQLETLSQLTHLQNHHHSQNSSASSAACATSFASSQHSAQNSSSLISNPINSLTFAHQQQQLAQSATVQPPVQPALPQQTGNSQQPVADLTAQPPFLHFLQQQSNHPFQYAAQNAIQSSEPASNTLNSQNFQPHHSNLAHPYNGSETPTNGGWPHSVFIPLASPASSSSCSSNAENNANRSNKLASNAAGASSLAKQYDHLAKPAARFALTSSALLQLNSTGTSPNRSPLSTTTSSPAQISHNSSTLSPVGFHHSSSSNAAYPLSSSLFPAAASVNTAQLQASSSSNESTANGYSNNSPRSPATTANTSTASSTSNSALAKSFTHLAHQSADPWSHTSNPTQPYLAFHSAAHNLAGYTQPSASSSSSSSAAAADKSDSSSTYNQYNSLLLAGNSLNNANNQSAAVAKQAASLTGANQLPHSLAHPTMPNHLTNYNYYHLNPLNQANALAGSASETATPAAISFHHSTANSFHYHYHHHNAANYNGYNYNYGLMPGFDNQVTDGPAKESLYWF